MNLGNDSKIGLATLIPGLLSLGALALFIVALWVHDGDVEQAGVWAAAVAVAFFGLLTTVVRLSQALVVKKAASPASAVTFDGPDPLDPPAIDEVPLQPTDARPPAAPQGG